MRNLARRYVTQEQRKAENERVTEDDVNEIKNDISAFRFEMIEIMRASGMNTQSATGPSGKIWFFIKIKRCLSFSSVRILLGRNYEYLLYLFYVQDLEARRIDRRSDV